MRFLALLLFPSLSFAAVTIGTNTALPVPAAAHYSSVVNVRPGNGETVSNNPPILSWFYNTNHIIGGEIGGAQNLWYWTNGYRLQITEALDTGFASPVVDIETPLNDYNFLAPLNTNTTRNFRWRVKYNHNGLYFTNGPYTFTIAGGAPEWDRSMLADTNYLATNGVHPIFCFRAGQESAIYTWMQTQPEWSTLLALANSTTNASYFKDHAEWGVNPNPDPSNSAINPADGLDRVGALGAVLLMWRVSADVRWTNASMAGWLVTNLNHIVNWHNSISNNWAFADYGGSASTPDFPMLMAAIYDWMYDFLGTNTATFNGQLRTNAQTAVRNTLLVQTHTIFRSESTTGGETAYYADYNYPQTVGSVPTHAWSKLPHSHKAVTGHTLLPLAVVLQQDGGAGAFAFNWMFNFMLARTTPYAGFAAHHSGPYGYVYGHTFRTSPGGGIVRALMHLDQSYPQAQIWRNDFCTRFPEWYSRLNPYRMRKYHGPYGDGMPASDYGNSGHMGLKAVGRDLAAITRSGIAQQGFNIASEYATDGASFVDLPLRYHYRTPPAVETNTTSKVYPEDGYVIASQISPSLPSSYTNGVGFSMIARPRGSTGGHNVYTDGSMDMWAYGAQLTDGGGAGLDDYGYNPEASPTLFVNGQGQDSPAYQWSPRIPVQASICNFTNDGTNFVYACADITGLFTNGWHPLSNLVTKVKRHVLFVRSKYWVLYDEFGTTSNATFAFRWHVPWVFRYAASSSPLANETAFSGDRYGSNSLAMLTNGFTYVAGNYTDSVYNDVPPRVNVHVMFANATNQWGVFNAVGTTSLTVGNTSVIGTADTNSTLSPFKNRTWATVNPDRAVGMWVTNREPATDFALMTVLVPQKPGVAAPTISRVSDKTVIVTYDGVTETNTFDSSYTGAFTYMVGESPTPSAPRILRFATDSPGKAVSGRAQK